MCIRDRMNGDGSIKSTTVSEHLYSASGLANVTDKTTLTDIQNLSLIHI